MNESTRRAEKNRRLAAKACAYCDVAPAGSVDHVPPRAFFQQPLNCDLMTVPCCTSCNQRFSLDDQYARIIIGSRQDVLIQPRLAALMAATIRAIEKPGNSRFREMMGRRVHRGNVRIRSGVILPDQHWFEVDRGRLVRWLQRLFRGLHYHELGGPVPEGFEISVHLGEDVSELVQDCVQWFAAEPLRRSGDWIFEFKWARIPDKPQATLWCIQFYRCAVFVGFIHPALPEAEGEREAAVS